MIRFYWVVQILLLGGDRRVVNQLRALELADRFAVRRIAIYVDYCGLPITTYPERLGQEPSRCPGIATLEQVEVHRARGYQRLETGITIALIR